MEEEAARKKKVSCIAENNNSIQHEAKKEKFPNKTTKIYNKFPLQTDFLCSIRWQMLIKIFTAMLYLNDMEIFICKYTKLKPYICFAFRCLIMKKNRL